jgi:hypothetical protein
MPKVIKDKIVKEEHIAGKSRKLTKGPRTLPDSITGGETKIERSTISAGFGKGPSHLTVSRNEETGGIDCLNKETQTQLTLGVATPMSGDFIAKCDKALDAKCGGYTGGSIDAKGNIIEGNADDENDIAGNRFGRVPKGETGVTADKAEHKSAHKAAAIEHKRFLATLDPLEIAVSQAIHIKEQQNEGIRIDVTGMKTDGAGGTSFTTKVHKNTQAENTAMFSQLKEEREIDKATIANLTEQLEQLQLPNVPKK